MGSASIGNRELDRQHSCADKLSSNTISAPANCCTNRQRYLCRQSVRDPAIHHGPMREGIMIGTAAFSPGPRGYRYRITNGVYYVLDYN